MLSKSQFGCHIEFTEILTTKLIAFDKLRLTTLLKQPVFSKYYYLEFRTNTDKGCSPISR